MKQEQSKLIKDILSQYVKEMGLEDGLIRLRIFLTYDLIVGERIAKATINKFYKDGILYCTINSSMLRMQIQCSKESIMHQINKMLNNNYINKIVIK